MHIAFDGITLYSLSFKNNMMEEGYEIISHLER